MPRIICVSNRVSLPDPKTGKMKAGGLAVGVKAALEGSGGGIWFGWDGSISEDMQRKRAVTRTDHGNITFLTMALNQKEYNEYYKSMSNEHLWPLMHGLGQYIETTPGAFQTYKQVNRIFAWHLKPFLRPDDIVWVHDYHLIPLGRELRALGAQNPIGYFNHIPMPARDFIEGPDVPDSLREQYRALLKDLFFYDLVGFQSVRDFKNFSTCFHPPFEIPGRYKALALRYHTHSTHFGIFPISIETRDLVRTLNNAAPQNIRAFQQNGYKTLIGAERLDYTKGLSYRLRGFYEFLDEYPEYRDKIKYHQITPLSRADIHQYKKAIEKTRQVVQDIKNDFCNQRFQPLVYREKSVPRDELMARMRYSNVGLVTPLIDGQNLVAKEYIAAQDPDDPGMLVLSKTAGAAEELEGLGVLCVDPKNPEDISQKIRQALNVPRLQRIASHRKAMNYLSRYDIDHWAKTFLYELRAHRARQQVFDPVANTLGGLFA